MPAGTGNVHGHVDNNEPLRADGCVNICVEHTHSRPLPPQAFMRLAAELVHTRTRAGETMVERPGESTQLAECA